MPSEFGLDESEGAIRVAVAPVLEFQFGLFLLRRHRIDPEKSVPQWVLEVTRHETALVDQLVSFWEASGLDDLDGSPYRECGELLVAGYRSQTLFSLSVRPFLDGLEAALASAEPVPALPSEPPKVVDLISRRLARLSADAVFRTDFITLVRKLFARIEPYWERGGRAGAERAAKDLVARARSGVDLRTLLPGNSFVHKDAFQAQMTAAIASNELVVVPLGLAGSGQFYWAFPGLVVVGAGIESADREARRKERAERAANRLKVLSDPTRVAILAELVRPTPLSATVTELARQFGLSQPTVSVHIKLLREAGLVRPEREANQVFYQSDEGTVRAYLNDAVDDILGAAPAPAPQPG